MSELIEEIAGLLWGPPTILLLLGTGLYLTVRLRFVQVRRLRGGFRALARASEQEAGEISPGRALSVALAATIGTGNIAGVATAIAMGGPGAVFWMWITAVVGMATKFAESSLGVFYRVHDPAGGYVGGPMYYIERALGPRWKPLAVLFAIFTVMTTMGTGNLAESNAVADTLEYSLRHVFGHEPGEAGRWIRLGIGVLYGGLVWLVIIGGVKRIGAVAVRLVPAMALLYVVGALVVLALHAEAVPGALALIVRSAFEPVAATGGFAGATVAAALRFGVARGMFSNEAGLGTGPIAHAAARTNDPVRQGSVALIEPLLDTLVVCTMTALVIIATGVWTSGASGAELTTMAFRDAMPGLGVVAVTLSLIVFSFTSVIGWSYYGERCVLYLSNARWLMPYRVLFCLALPLGAAMKLDLVWALADASNALMAVPNLIALIALAGTISRIERRSPV